MNSKIKTLITALVLITTANKEVLASALIDTFNIQSYLKLSNNSPITATTGDFVFAIFKGTNCIWAKRYSGIVISNGVMNHKINGMGTNISAINNTSAPTGECVGNFSSINLDANLLSAGTAASLIIRVYTESSIDTQKPIWDIPLNSAPTAFIANTANSANDLVSTIKTNSSSGATDAGKFAVLNSSGYIDNTMLNFSTFTFSNSQISGLGTACTMNTGNTIGTIPTLGSGGKISSTALPTFQANKIIATDATGTMSGAFNTTQTSSGSSDVNKIPLLNASGKIDQSMVDSTNLSINPSNLSAPVPVTNGGTGAISFTNNALLTGNGPNTITGINPGTAGTILYSNGTTWSAAAPNAAGIVDTTSNQSAIAGNKTFTGTTTLSGSITLGNGGATFQKVLNCTIPNTLQVSGSETISTCTGATTSSIAHCSPTNGPTGWIIGSARIGSSNTVSVLPYQVTGTNDWTTGFQCVVFVP